MEGVSARPKNAAYRLLICYNGGCRNRDKGFMERVDFLADEVVVLGVEAEG